MMTDEERAHLEKVKCQGGRCECYGNYCQRCLIYKEVFAPKNITTCGRDSALNAALKLLDREIENVGVYKSIW